MVAKLPGGEHADEAVIFSAHWDAFGIGQADAKGDRIITEFGDQAYEGGWMTSGRFRYAKLGVLKVGDVVEPADGDIDPGALISHVKDHLAKVLSSELFFLKT